MSKTYRKNKHDETIQDKDRRNMRTSRQCLNHGGCPYCLNNRTHSHKKSEPIVIVEDLEIIDDYQS